MHPSFLREMELVDMAKLRNVLGIERQFRGFCSCFFVVGLLLWLCCVPTACLQYNDENEISLLSITDSLQPGSERSSLRSIVTDSLKSSADYRSSPWELPITTEPACDLSSGECRGSIVTDDVVAGDNAGRVTGKDTEVEKQAVVLCNVKCFRADPVCGEDAITYWCGDAEAKCAGVEVAYKGYCDSRSGGAGKDGSRAAQSLFLVHLIWLVLAGVLVIADLL